MSSRDGSNAIFERFTQSAVAAVLAAERLALDADRDLLPDDLLRGVLGDRSSAAAACLRNLGVDVDALVGDPIPPAQPGETRAVFSPESKRVLEGTLRAALRLKHDYLSSAHMLVALYETQLPIRVLLEAEGVTSSGLDRETMRASQHLLTGWESGFDGAELSLGPADADHDERSVLLIQGDDIGEHTTWFRWWLDDPRSGPHTWSFLRSSRERLLEEWEVALPTPRPGEGLHGALDRAFAGPLRTPRSERALMARLGYSLLPGFLTAEILSRRSRGLSVEVRFLPPPSCASIPWALVPLADSPRFVDSLSRPRLGMVADVVSDVPTSFHAGRGRVPGGEPASGTVRVIDPKVSIAGRLFTQEQQALLDEEGGFAAGSRVDPAMLADRLTQVPPPEALLFVGHVTDGDFSMHLSTPDRGSAAALPADAVRGRLSAADLVLGTTRDGAGALTGPEIWPMPPKVAIVACNSGSDLSRREPFGLVIACLNGGAEWVLATHWVLPADRRFRPSDRLDDDDAQPLFDCVRIAEAVVEAADPVRALAALLRERIAAWEGLPQERELPGESPLTWGALAVFRAPAIRAERMG